MIIVALAGGLGNQLFQYAAGLELARRLGAPLKLDISGYAHQSLRAYRLGHFQISATPATPEEITRVRGLEGRECPGGPAGLLCRVARRLALLRPRRWRRLLRERHYQFDPAFLKQRAPAYIVGHWQSERYFKHIAPELRRELRLREGPGAAGAALAQEIESVCAVGVHVRRGDYATDPAVAQVHGVCPPDYYHAAAALIAGRVDSPRFFVFSDEPAWARANLRLPGPTSFVAQNGPERDYEDLWLLSRCRHQIIANSSFSWWGAWLATAPDQIVVAPQRWFRDNARRTDDLLPASWNLV